MRGLKAQFGGTNAPRLDLYGCILYLPLWDNKMVARGGSIVNGTGTMATSPTNLAVGSNTITATGAGTFIIYTPIGGTCTSGTATITGSPVTLNAGSTTITTGVTTGTFTVTPSNIIKSRDSGQRQCTITGATWTSKGRDFDGVDDFISIPDNAAWSFAGSDFAISIWLKRGETAASGMILGQGTAAGVDEWYLKFHSTNALRLLFTDTLAASQLLTTTGTIAETTIWHHIVAQRRSDVLEIYVDAVIDATTLNVAGKTMAEPTSTLCIGRMGAYDGDYGKNMIGDVWIYNRGFTPQEIIKLYQITKGRY